MKFKTLATTVLATAAIFALGACGNSNGAKESNDIVKEVKEDTTITFWHAMYVVMFTKARTHQN